MRKDKCDFCGKDLTQSRNVKEYLDGKCSCVNCWRTGEWQKAKTKEQEEQNKSK